MIFRFGTYGAILFIGVLYISSLFRNKKKISTPVLFATVYSAIIFISTVLNNGEIVSCLVEGLSLIALFMLSDSICQKSVSRFLRIIYPIFYTFVVINFITMLIYPNGMYTVSYTHLDVYKRQEMMSRTLRRWSSWIMSISITGLLGWM